MYVCIRTYFIATYSTCYSFFLSPEIADIKLWFDGMSTEQRIHVVRPNLALTLRARGTILNSDDEVEQWKLLLT